MNSDQLASDVADDKPTAAPTREKRTNKTPFGNKKVVLMEVALGIVVLVGIGAAIYLSTQPKPSTAATQSKQSAISSAGDIQQAISDIRSLQDQSNDQLKQLDKYSQ